MIGVETWMHECINSGPDGMWFASSLISILVMYGLLRLIFSAVQDALSAHRQKDYTLPYSRTPTVTLSNGAITVLI